MIPVHVSTFVLHVASPCLASRSAQSPRGQGPDAQQRVVRQGRSIHLERQPRLDLVLQRLSDGAIKVGEDLHRQLRVDAVLADEIVKGVSQRIADAVETRGRVPPSG